MLIDELRRAREGKGLTREALALRVNMTAKTIKRMEGGTGSVGNLMRVMQEVEFNISGLARGATIVEQIANARRRRGLSLEAAAARADIARGTLAGLERGEGTVRPLLKVLSVLGRKARRAEPLKSSWAYDRDGKRDVRFTPRWFVDHVVASFGRIDLDPCAHPLSPVTARRRIILPECGLAGRWSGQLAYVNPPFSALVRWLDRAADAYETGEVETIVLLCPVRTDSAVFRDRLAGKTDIALLSQRMRFLTSEGEIGYPAPFSLMVLIWGGTPEQITQFAELVPATWIPRDRENRDAPHAVGKGGPCRDGVTQ